MRRGTGERTTDFVSVRAEAILDGEGRVEIGTGLPFLDHLLTVFARTGLFDVAVTASGGPTDRVGDADHIAEGAGAAVGQAIRRALGHGRGVARFGDVAAPASEAVSRAVVEISGEGEFYLHGSLPRDVRGAFEGELAESFLRLLSRHAGITLHLTVVEGTNGHHVLESAFKAVALALRAAIACDSRAADAPAVREDGA